MARPDKRSALQVLPKLRLRGLLDAFELKLAAAGSKDAHVELLARSRKATLPRLLERLLRDELRDICVAHGLDDGGREKAVLIARLLGEPTAPAAAEPARSPAPPPPASARAMRLTAITSRNAIRLAYAAFRRQLRSGARERRKIGNRAGADEVAIDVHKDLGFWVFLGAGADMNQSWNPFGDLGGAYRDPQATLPMQCQINFPHEGINRRVGGLFARDRNGRVYVTHSGKLGGGRVNIGKSGFHDFLAGQHPGIDWADIDWGAGAPSRHVVVGDVESVRFRANVGRFVQTCAEYKRLAVAGTSEADPPEVLIEQGAPLERHPRPPLSAKAEMIRSLDTFFRTHFADKDLLLFVKRDLCAVQLAESISAHGSPAAISYDVAERLDREGFIDADLFSALRRRFPRLHREVAPLERQWKLAEGTRC